jgi:hypothetical protein
MRDFRFRFLRLSDHQLTRSRAITRFSSLFSVPPRLRGRFSNFGDVWQFWHFWQLTRPFTKSRRTLVILSGTERRKAQGKVEGP